MKKIYALLLTLTVSALSFGQVTYLNDGFNYPDNTLLTANGWTAHSSGGTQAIDVGASNGLVYAGYNDGPTSVTGLTSGNAARLDNNGEDVNKTFTAITSGDVYYSFLVNVSSGTAGYFTHFNTGSFACRIFVQPSANAGKVNFGISNSGTGNFGSLQDFDLNTTYLIVAKYNVSATGAASLWVLPAGIPASEAAAGAPVATASGTGQASINAIALRQYSATQNITMDGILLSSTWLGTTPCNLALGTDTAVCDAVTLAIDTYTATIPFTGGNTGTYNLSSNVGTIGGDNPTTTATGNITISGIPEGTNVTLTITGTCGLSKVVTAPICKPINTLPINEPFNYTVSSALNSSQMWSILNTGDDITVVSGNLSYPGITATGNSVNFTGVGAESRTPFTPTTSGTLYASFIATVPDISNITTDLADTYFAVFNDNGTGLTNARLWHRRNGTQSQFGISTAAANSTVVWSPNMYTPGTALYLVLGYDFTNNIVTLTENPTIGGTASPTVALNLTAPIATIGGFTLRQDASNTTPTINIDELRIDTTPNFTLGTASFNNISGLNIYPNPANDYLHVVTAANGVKNIVIYDVVGKEVVNTTTANEVINVSSLNAGIYMVKITEEGKTATRKLVIK